MADVVPVQEKVPVHNAAHSESSSEKIPEKETSSVSHGDQEIDVIDDHDAYVSNHWFLTSDSPNLPRSKPFPIDPNDPEETHQLTFR